MADKKKTASNKQDKKAIRKKPKKVSKYDEKFVINGTFQQLVKELVSPKK